MEKGNPSIAQVEGGVRKGPGFSKFCKYQSPSHKVKPSLRNGSTENDGEMLQEEEEFTSKVIDN